MFLVANESRFNLVFANEIDIEALTEAPAKKGPKLSLFGPRLVGVRLPECEAERQSLLGSYMQTGADLHQLPKYYVDYREVVPALLR